MCINDIKQTVQSMIDANAPMVFYYTHSKPELKRIVHPILIIKNHVVCVDSNTGLHKRFKLNGIQFPPAPAVESPKIISKTHFWDCGFSWDYENDCCNCCETGWTRCLFSDGHQEILNNM